MLTLPYGDQRPAGTTRRTPGRTAAVQFFLREGLVWKLWTETGDIETLGVSLENFLAAAPADPVDYSDQAQQW